MKKFSQSGLSALFLAMAAALPLHAGAGVFDDDEARKAILELRAKVNALDSDLKTKLDTKSDKSSTLDLVTQNELTLQEIAKLRGQIEVLANEISNAQKRQKDFYVDLDTRLRKLEPRQVTIDGKAAQVAPSEQKSYDAALLLFKAGDYKTAAVALGEFLRQYPESGYAPEAQYNLGSAFYAQRDCKSAIAAQQVLVNAYPDSSKVPDAMLNIGTCQQELKDKAWKKTMQDLIKAYPSSTAAGIAKDRLAAK